MEVNLNPQAEAHLLGLAQKTGCAPEALIEEATVEYLKQLSGHRMAQYNTLTTRITYYVTLQYATWGAAAAISGYLATLWSAGYDRKNLDWITMVCLLAVSWAVLHINYEMFVIVRYLKEVLLGGLATDFEGWIRKLGRLEDFHRNLAPNLIFGVGFLVLVVLISQDVCGHWASSDTSWLIVSGALAAIVSVKIWRIWVVNKQIEQGGKGIAWSKLK